MIKDIILRQKEEKERLLAKPYVEREKLEFGKKWLDSDLVKVVLGPRRAGKSVFSLMMLKDAPFAYFNFDDEMLPAGEKLDTGEIIEGLKMIYGDFKYVFFDEIQNLSGWELFANRLHREGYNLTVTGSNANLLSRELATHLTGRHIPIEIMPFNFGEFLRAKNFDFQKEKMSLHEERGRVFNLVEQYMAGGGYPEVVVAGIDPNIYLGALFDSVLFKDVVLRYRVKNLEQINRLALYLANNAAAQSSGQRLAKFLGFKSNATLEKYLGYLEESYLAMLLQCYSAKAGRRLMSPRKIYVVDNGFIGAKAVQFSPDRGKLVENMVFGEMIKRGSQKNKDLFYYKTRNNREIDFVIRKGIQISELVQVAYAINDELTQKREIKALIEAAEELGNSDLTILNWEEEKEVKENGKTINLVPIWKWLVKE